MNAINMAGNDHANQPPWQSLAALVRDVNGLQSQNQTLSEQLWESGATVQQLSLQVDHLNANLVRSDGVLHQVQAELQQQSGDLEMEKEQRILGKQSLDYEFLKHAEAQKNLNHAKDLNRCFVALMNNLKFSGSSSDLGVLLPENFQIGTLLKENHDTKQEVVARRSQLEHSNRSLDRKNRAIRDLEHEKDVILQALDMKENEIIKLKSELNQFYSDDDETEAGSPTLGKRKRVVDETE